MNTYWEVRDEVIVLVQCVLFSSESLLVLDKIHDALMMASELPIQSVQFLLHSAGMVDRPWTAYVGFEIPETGWQTSDWCFSNTSSSLESRESALSFFGHCRDARGKYKRQRQTTSDVNRDQTNEYPGQQVYPARRTNKWWSFLTIDVDM